MVLADLMPMVTNIESLSNRIQKREIWLFHQRHGSMLLLIRNLDFLQPKKERAIHGAKTAGKTRSPAGRMIPLRTNIPKPFIFGMRKANIAGRQRPGPSKMAVPFI